MAAGALVALSPKPSRAEQLTLFDVTFDFTWDGAVNSKPSQSLYYVKSDKLNAQRPTNWVAPIVTAPARCTSTWGICAVRPDATSTRRHLTALNRKAN